MTGGRTLYDGTTWYGKTRSHTNVKSNPDICVSNKLQYQEKMRATTTTTRDGKAPRNAAPHFFPFFFFPPPPPAPPPLAGMGVWLTDP